MQALTQMVNNIALLVVLGALHSLLLRHLGRGPIRYRAFTGLLFGTAAVIGMSIPYQLAPGAIFDGRSILVSLAGLFGGPLAAGISALLAGAYRVWLGGVGALTGVLVILASAGIGVAYGCLGRREPRYLALPYLYAFGLLVHLVMLLLMLTLPADLGYRVLERITLPVLLVYPPATVIIAALLLGQEERVGAVRALQESEARYRTLFENSLDAVLLTTPDGRILSANPAACRLFGRPVEEICRLGRAGLVDPADPRLAPALEERERTGRFQGELTFRRADGDRFPGEISTVAFQDGSGETRTSMIIRDVSERKAHEERLRRINRRLRLSSLCSQALLRLAEEGELLREVCRLIVEEGGYRLAWVGYAENDPERTVRPVAQAGVEAGYVEGLQLTWAETGRGRGPTGRAIRSGQPCVVRGGDPEPDFALWREVAARDGFASSVSLPLRTPEGVFGILAIHAAEPDAFGEDEVGLLMGLADDLAHGITALRTRAAHELALEEIEALAKFPAENPHPILRADARGVLTYANAASRPLLGLWNCRVGQPLPAPQATAAAEALQAGRIQEAELRAGGQVFSLLFVPVASGGYVNLYGRDVTERVRAFEALAESEVRFRQMAETIGEVFWIVTPDWGQVLYISPAYEATWGRSCAGLLERSGEWQEAVLEEDREAVAAAVARKVAGDWSTPDLPAYRIRRPDGTLRWIRARAFPVRDASGAVYRVAGIATDITERKEAERARALLLEALGASVNEIYLFDAETYRFRYVNAGAAANLGYSPAQLQEMTPLDLKPEFTRESFETLVAPLRRQEERVRVFETVHRRADGSLYPVEARLQLFEHGPERVFLAVIQDITGRMQAEAALRESEARLRLALGAASQGLYDLNIQTGEAVVTPEYATLLGYDPASFVETNAAWIERLHPEDREQVAATYRAYVRGEISQYRVEFRQRTATGEYKWILSLGRIAEWDPEGNPLRMLGTHTDITERKAAEEAILQLNEELERRVDERTGELRRTVQLMAGREIRMAELKAIIRRLEGQLREAGLVPAGEGPGPGSEAKGAGASAAGPPPVGDRGGSEMDNDGRDAVPGRG